MSRKDRAFAYHYRGLAYNELAIADLRRAFEVNPSDYAKKNLKRLGVTTISAALKPREKTVLQSPVKAEIEPNHVRKNLGCKKFFPALGMALTVPCD